MRKTSDETKRKRVAAAARDLYDAAEVHELMPNSGRAMVLWDALGDALAKLDDIDRTRQYIVYTGPYGCWYWRMDLRDGQISDAHGPFDTPEHAEADAPGWSSKKNMQLGY